MPRHGLFRVPTVVSLLVSLLAPAGIAVRLAGASAATSATCAAVGSYHIGTRLVPGPVAPLKPGQQRNRPPSAAKPGYILPQWDLEGTLTLSSYSGCGAPTSGDFTVQRVIVGNPVGPQPQAGSGPAIACAIPCRQRPYGIVAASGHFVQDSAHPNDPLYVTVDATLTSVSAGPLMGRPCSVTYGCPGTSVVTTTVSMTAVTGYLVLSGSGKPAASRGSANAGAPMPSTVQQATLSFLPPPARGATASAALVLDGWRGSAGPIPAPGPTMVPGGVR
ncbi:MAG TPA: hypothetical protein VFE42_14670 [Chloroflexota bacterium]|nr:hypothetical protein [Chloroflexota bacterium]